MADAGAIIVLSADGQTAAYTWPGGLGLFTAYGTFGSGTAKLQYSVDDGTTYIDAGADSEFTSDDGIVFELPNCLARADLSGYTSPTLNIKIEELLHRTVR